MRSVLLQTPVMQFNSAREPSYKTPAHAARLSVNIFGRKFGRKYRQICHFSANLPVANVLTTKVRLPFPLHGMEEVVGSIPTRSTIFSMTYKFPDRSVGSIW
jgi:hypothetical protein